MLAQGNLRWQTYVMCVLVASLLLTVISSVLVPNVAWARRDDDNKKTYCPIKKTPKERDDDNQASQAERDREREQAAKAREAAQKKKQQEARMKSGRVIMVGKGYNIITSTVCIGGVAYNC